MFIVTGLLMGLAAARAVEERFEKIADSVIDAALRKRKECREERRQRHVATMAKVGIRSSADCLQN